MGKYVVLRTYLFVPAQVSEIVEGLLPLGKREVAAVLLGGLRVAARHDKTVHHALQGTREGRTKAGGFGAAWRHVAWRHVTERIRLKQER